MTAVYLYLLIGLHVSGLHQVEPWSPGELIEPWSRIVARWVLMTAVKTVFWPAVVWSRLKAFRELRKWRRIENLKDRGTV